ncbi:endonuclease domain-containing protein [Phenylobacterium sp.]|uniref:endonuclease domain-containing protein n=1 Tax=Phenylobacterium sp. TaxID=1871053 RepID=UPI0035B02B09
MRRRFDLLPREVGEGDPEGVEGVLLEALNPTMSAPKPTIRRARSLRRRLTPPEARLWMALRRKGLAGFRFRRQHPIGPYVLDFYCEAVRLAVEVDGLRHDFGDGPERAELRDAWLAERDVRVLRISATDVRDDLDGVVRTILAWLTSPQERA